MLSNDWLITLDMSLDTDIFIPYGYIYICGDLSTAFGGVIGKMSNACVGYPSANYGKYLKEVKDLGAAEYRCLYVWYWTFDYINSYFDDDDEEIGTYRYSGK